MVKKRNLTKEKIIEKAFELANEITLENVTFQNLAERLNIKYPSLYNHFKNMEELKTYMTISLTKDLNAKLMEQLIGISGENAIRVFAKVYKEFAFDNRTAYFLYINIRNLKSEEVQNLINTTSAIIKQVLNYYVKTEDEIIHKSRALRSMLHGFISLYFLGYFKNQVDLEKSFNIMIEDYIYGLNR